jgi:hypothetical protein
VNPVTVTPRLGVLWAITGLGAGAAIAWALDADIWAFSLAFACLAGLPLLERSDARALDPFRPLLGLSVLLFLYSLSTLIFVSEERVTYYGESVSLATMVTYSQACLLCMAGISAGTLLAQGERVGHAVPVPAPEPFISRRNIYHAALALGLALSPFVYQKFQPWNATSYADVALTLRVDNLSDQAAGVREILLENIPTSLILAACTLVMFDRKRQAVLRVLAAVMVLAYLATAMLSGWRGHLMFAALTVAIYFHWKVRPLRLLPLAAAAVLSYVLINALSVARISSNPVEMAMALVDNVGEAGLGFLALKQSGELATSTNLLRLITGLEGGETQYGMGSIALNQLLAFAPRTVLPDRPPVASELFVQVFYPGVFESGGGYGFFLPQDGYWDFGLAGVFFYSVVLGLALESLYRWFLHRRHSDFMVLLYAVLYSQLVLSVVRSGLFASLKAALIASIPLLVVLLGHAAWRLALGLPMRPVRQTQGAPD